MNENNVEGKEGIGRKYETATSVFITRYNSEGPREDLVQHRTTNDIRSFFESKYHGWKNMCGS